MPLLAAFVLQKVQGGPLVVRRIGLKSRNVRQWWQVVGRLSGWRSWIMRISCVGHKDQEYGLTSNLPTKTVMPFTQSPQPHETH